MKLESVYFTPEMISERRERGEDTFNLKMQTSPKPPLCLAHPPSPYREVARISLFPASHGKATEIPFVNVNRS